MERFESSPVDLLRMAGGAARFGVMHAADRLLAPPAKASTRIPWHFRAVTPEWLTAVLCADVPGARVESAELGTGHTGTSGRQQYRLTYNAAGRDAGLPETIFAKGTPTWVTRISMTTVPSMQLEANFYNRVRPLLEIEAPRGYYSAYDLFTGRSIHLLEDLVRTKGATFPKATTRISRAQAEDVVSVLAALHGRFLGDPALDKEFGDFLTYPQEYGRMARAMSLRRYHFTGFDKAGDAIPEPLRCRRDETWDAILRSVRLHDTLPQTLAHCDVHLGNWYQTGEGRMGLLDWQCVAKGHWSRDLAYAITSTLRIEDRRAWEEDLIRLYLDELKSRSGQTVPFDEALLRYRQQIWGGLVFWTPTYSPPAFAPNDMQPEELSLELITRFAHAIVDHDSLASLDER